MRAQECKVDWRLVEKESLNKSNTTWFFPPSIQKHHYQRKKKKKKKKKKIAVTVSEVKEEHSKILKLGLEVRHDIVHVV